MWARTTPLWLAVDTVTLRSDAAGITLDEPLLVELGFAGWYDPALGDVAPDDTEHARLVDDIATGSAAFIDADADGNIDDDERAAVAVGPAHPDDATPPFWIAVGDGGLRLSSLDGGLSWTDPIFDDGDDLDLNLCGAASGLGRAVAVGGWDSYGRALRTFDGQTWEDVTLDWPLFGALWVDDRFIAVGDGVQAWSWDGLTWDPSSTLSGYFKAVARDDTGRLLAVGLSGVSAWSDDGISWSSSPNITGSPDLVSLAWGSGVFVAVGGSTALRSTDGLSWEDVTPPGAQDLRGLVYDGTTFTAADGGAIYRSADGKTWTTAAASVVWLEQGEQEWVGIGEGDALLTSADGESWTEQSADSGAGVLNALTYRP